MLTRYDDVLDNDNDSDSDKKHNNDNKNKMKENHDKNSDRDNDRDSDNNRYYRCYMNYLFAEASFRAGYYMKAKSYITIALKLYNNNKNTR